MLALVAAAGLHLGVAADHGREAASAGAFFVGAAVLQLVLAAAMALRPSARVFRATIGANAVLIFIWAAARLTVVPLSGHSGPEAVGVFDGIAVLAEIAATAAALILLRAPAHARSGSNRPARRILSPALAVAAAGILSVSIFATAAVSGGDDHHEDGGNGDVDHADGSEHEHSGTSGEHDDDATHAQQAEELVTSLMEGFARDGVCARGEPPTWPDCQPGG